MTYQEIFIQIISEVSGKPKKEISDLLINFQKAHPGGKWNKIIPEHEAEELLSQLRAEAPGIMAWLFKGAMDVASNKPTGVH